MAIDPRVAKLRAKASDPAVTGPEAVALRAKADELEAKAAKITSAEPGPQSFLNPLMQTWLRDVASRMPHSHMFDDLIEPGYEHDDDDPNYGYENY